MRRNRLIIIFVLILFGPYWVLVQGLKSEYVIQFLLTELRNRVAVLKDYNLEFDSIEISFLRLQTKFINTKINQEGNFNLKGVDVTFDFSVGNLVKKDLTIDKVIISGGKFSFQRRPDTNKETNYSFSIPKNINK